MKPKSLRDHFPMPQADIVDNLPHGYGPVGMQRATALIRSAGMQSNQYYKPNAPSTAKAKQPLLGAASGLAATIASLSGYSAPRARNVVPMRAFKPAASFAPSLFGTKIAA